MEKGRNFKLTILDFIKAASEWSFKKYLFWSVVVFVIAWLTMGGIVEQMYLWTSPTSTILEVKVVSKWFKWGFGAVVFVLVWLVRWNELRLYK